MSAGGTVKSGNRRRNNNSSLRAVLCDQHGPLNTPVRCRLSAPLVAGESTEALKG